MRWSVINVSPQGSRRTAVLLVHLAYQYSLEQIRSFIEVINAKHDVHFFSNLHPWHLPGSPIQSVNQFFRNTGEMPLTVAAATLQIPLSFSNHAFYSFPLLLHPLYLFSSPSTQQWRVASRRFVLAFFFLLQLSTSDTAGWYLPKQLDCFLTMKIL